MFDDYLRHLKERIEGDGYVRLLKSNLESGHQIQKVTFVPAEDGQPAIYRFLLARLGTLTDVDVPAGTEAIEQLLVDLRLRLETEDDEVKRSALRFGRTLNVLDVRQLLSGIAYFAARAGALASGQALKDIGYEEPTVSTESLVLAGTVFTAFDEQVKGLVRSGHLDVERAATIVDRGLADFIRWARALA